MNSELCIHVGLRKTATTWLQECVFSKTDSLHYLGKTEREYPRWLIEWHYLDDFAFEEKKNGIRETLLGRLRCGATNLISSEAFTNTAAIWPQAHRIHELVPKAKIVLVIRNPIELVKSHYRSRVRDGLYYLDLKEYLDWERTPFDLFKRKSVYLPDFFLDENIEIYRRLFGAENLCVLRYEEILDDGRAFLSKLGSFLRVDLSRFESVLAARVNAGPADSELRPLRARNFADFLRRHFPDMAREMKPLDLTSDMSEAIMDAETTEKLQRYFRGKAAPYL